jgi:hypothetical protein
MLNSSKDATNHITRNTDGWAYFRNYLDQIKFNIGQTTAPTDFGECRANAWAWSPAAICDACGHHGLVHPGPNRTDVCGLCALETITIRMLATLAAIDSLA